ncbi:MAG: phosphodiester glycosidase family protein [Acidobacteria bacterium]|nr:phosphodiester glycosidase family protein [Acidobacteriota bacterium]
MRHWLFSLLSAAMLVLTAIGQQSTHVLESGSSDILAPGIELVSIKRGDFSESATGNRWTINILQVDPKRAGLRLAQAMDEIAGAETTSSMAARYGALAGINGGYFRTTGIVRGEPVGALVIGEKLLSEPVKNRAALAIFDDGKQIHAAVTHVTTVAELRAQDKIASPINGFNRPREKDELMVFTPEFHRTTLTNSDGAEFIVQRNRVTSVKDSIGSQRIPNNGFVISATGKAREWALKHLRTGTRIEISTKIKTEPTIAFKPDFILGGGPQLVADGKKSFASEATRYSDSLYRQRHPRTAIGWRTNGTFILLTVDGRQKQSVGMTLDELAELMLELGCVEAMNLDGGGSTTMVVKNKIVNSPSDATGERAVSDALLIFPREKRK